MYRPSRGHEKVLYALSCHGSTFSSANDLAKFIGQNMQPVSVTKILQQLMREGKVEQTPLDNSTGVTVFGYRLINGGY